MQPYFLPYIGYFQLLNLVDTFIFYDDVNFMKQGYVNSNQIPTNNFPVKFTIPLKSQSSFIPIKDTYIHTEIYKKWKNKFIKTIDLNYAKAPNFHEIRPLLNQILELPSNSALSIATLAKKSVMLSSKFMGIETKIIQSSSIFNNSNLNSENRVIDICKQIGAKEYINPIGGIKLYNTQTFDKENIKLSFLKTTFALDTNENENHHYYSIIDDLMKLSKDELQKKLESFKLIILE